MIKITYDIYVYPFDDSFDQPNIGYIKGKNNALLIDIGGSKRVYDLVYKDLNTLNLIKPNFLVITHFHWDHSFASYYFDGVIIGTKTINKNFDLIRKIKAKKIEDLISNETIPLFCLKDLKKEYQNVDEIKLKDANLVINNEIELDLGDKIVKIIPCVSPHTDGSLLVFSKDDKVLFVGDAEYGEIQDYDFIMDYKKLKKYIDIISSIDCEIIVNGHSEIMKKNEYIIEISEDLK